MKKCLLFLSAILLGTTLFAQPANDDCASAIDIMVDDVVTFSTLMATTDGLISPCFGDNDSIPADIWYTWTAPTSGNYNWTNCGTADYDSRIAIYANATACPPSDATLVDCNDDGPIADCAIFESSLSFAATAGTVYTIRVGGFQNNPDSLPTMGSGTFILTELPTGPLNDLCANAIPLTLGEEVNFSTINGLNDGPEFLNNTACFGFGGTVVEGDIWYTYTSNFDGFVRWETCGTLNFDSKLVVYNPGSACPPLADDLYGCNDDSGCPMFHSTLDYAVVNGETYLMQLGGFTANTGNGTFTFDKYVPPTPPENDNCSSPDSAFVITAEVADMQMEGIFFGTTLNASSEADFEEPICNPFNPGGEFNDVWYSFNSAGNSELEFRFTPILLEDGIFICDIFEVCGTADTLLVGNCFFNAADGESVRDTLTGLPAVPTEYLFRVTSRLVTETPGPFFFQIVGEMVISSNEELSAIDQLTIAPNPTNDLTNVDFTLTENKQLAITITNNVGAIVQHQSAQDYQTGNHRIELEMIDLPAGIYFVSINDGTSAKIEKLVKL